MNIAIVGAGLAGLAAGCELADAGHRVTLFEKRPFAGGKTYTFRDAETGDLADNGQHVFMHCTTAYTDFLRRLGTLHLAKRQKRLRVGVYDANGRRSVIAAARLPAPLHLLPSFARYKHLGIHSKVRAGRLLAQIARMSEAHRLGLWTTTFEDWLRSHGQTDIEIARLWDFLLLPTLNARSSQVAASDALFVIREGFLASSRSAAIGVSTVGLSALHVDPAVAYITARGGRLCTSSNVAAIEADGRRATLHFAKGEQQEFDAVICATGHVQAQQLLPRAVLDNPAFAGMAGLETASIVNLHVWFDRPVAPFSMAAFIDSELQWVFNRGRLDQKPRGDGEHLVVSVSGAQPYMGMEKGELERHFVGLVREALPAARGAKVERFLAIKEPEATFVPAPGVRRPPNATGIRNLVVAGAYTATGWPSTMESAIRSGLTAARDLHHLCAGTPAREETDQNGNSRQ